MKNIFYKSLIIGTLAATNACSYKKESRLNHENKQSTEIGFEDQKANARLNIDLNEVYIRLQTAKSDKEINGILDQLETTAINETTIGNPYLNKSAKLKTALSYYNFAFLKLSENEKIKRFSTYQKLLLKGCNQALTSCENLAFFKTDPKTATIIAEIAENTKDITQYYQLLGVAIDLNNSLRNRKTEILYIKRANEYASHLRKQDVAASESLLQKHGLIFESILSESEANKKDSTYEKIITDFNPWTYSRLEANEFPYGIKQMFAIAAEHYLYDNDKKRLSPLLANSIESIQNTSDKVGPSFKMTLDELTRDSKNREVLKNLKIDQHAKNSELINNEYFFMIDRLYRGHLGIEEVSLLWNGSKKDESKLLDIAHFYIKIEFVKMLFDTNKYMSSILFQRDIPNNELFRQVIQRSEPLTKQWGTMLSRIENISIFATQQLRSNKDNSENLKNIQMIINEVKNTASYMSIMPNQFLLTYKMIDLKAPLTINTWWGAQLSIDPTTIVNLLLDGDFKEPWFIYGGNTTALNKIEIIYAINYAMLAGTFDAFHVPAVDFFKKVLKKSMQSDIDQLENILRNSIDQRSSDSNYQAFLNICENENAKNKNYSVQLDLTDLQNFSLFGSPSSGYIKSGYGIYNHVGPINSVYEARARIESRLSQVKAITNLIKIPEIDSEIKKIEDLKLAFIKELTSQHRLVNDCTTKLMMLEKERQGLVLKEHMNFVAKVYDLLKAKYDKNEVNESLLIPGESIKDHTFSFNHYAFLKRIHMHSQNMSPRVDINEPDQMTINALSSKIEKISFLNNSNQTAKSKEEFISEAMTLLNPQTNHVLLWLQETTKISHWISKINAMVYLYKMGLESNLKEAVSAKEIIQESIKLTRFINIEEQDKTWLLAMNRKEQVPRQELNGFLFESSGNDYIGIMDQFFAEATDFRFTLNEANSFYTTYKNLGNFLFPPSFDVHVKIDENYRIAVQRSEKITNDFIEEIKKLEPYHEYLKIRIRVDGDSDQLYTTKLIDGGRSVLVDQRKIQDIKAQWIEFHSRKTANHFKKDFKEK